MCETRAKKEKTTMIIRTWSIDQGAEKRRALCRLSPITTSFIFNQIIFTTSIVEQKRDENYRIGHSRTEISKDNSSTEEDAWMLCLDWIFIFLGQCFLPDFSLRTRHRLDSFNHSSNQDIRLCLDFSNQAFERRRLRIWANGHVIKISWSVTEKKNTQMRF